MCISRSLRRKSTPAGYLGTSQVTFTVDASGTPDTFRMQIRPDFIDPQEYVFRRK